MKSSYGNENLGEGEGRVEDGGWGWLQLGGGVGVKTQILHSARSIPREEVKFP